MSYQTGDSFPVDDAARHPRPAPKPPAVAKKTPDFDEALAPKSLPVTTFAGLVAGLVVSGGLIFLGLNRSAPAQNGLTRQGRRAPRRGASRSRIAPVTLSGPFGAELSLPQDEPIIVNVYLEGCSDCMPAFQAYNELDAPLEDLGVPVINVAYGRAGDFSKEWGLAENLVVDRGGAIVMPLGIGTFTTLVIDAEGRVRARVRPTEDGYRRRIAEAVDAAW